MFFYSFGCPTRWVVCDDLHDLDYLSCRMHVLRPIHTLMMGTHIFLSFFFHLPSPVRPPRWVVIDDQHVTACLSMAEHRMPALRSLHTYETGPFHISMPRAFQLPSGIFLLIPGASFSLPYGIVPPFCIKLVALTTQLTSVKMSSRVGSPNYLVDIRQSV